MDLTTWCKTKCLLNMRKLPGPVIRLKLARLHAAPDRIISSTYVERSGPTCIVLSCQAGGVRPRQGHSVSCVLTAVSSGH